MESELVEKLKKALADAEIELSERPNLAGAVGILHSAVQEALTLARSLPAWPPMREAATAPDKGCFLFAASAGLVNTGWRDGPTFWAIDNEAGKPLRYHIDQVLGWWPLPEVK